MVDTRSPSHILVVAPGPRPVRLLERVLARLGTERRPPHEIRVVASAERIAEVHRSLLGDGAASRFAELCTSAGFSCDEILFNARTLHVVDVAPGDGCGGSADQLLNVLRTFTASDAASLTLVVAEDAGAVGDLLHACLQVAGRISDRLLLDITPPGARGRTRGVEGRLVEIPLLLWPANEPVPATYAEAVQRRRIDRRRIASPDVLSLDSAVPDSGRPRRRRLPSHAPAVRDPDPGRGCEEAVGIPATLPARCLFSLPRGSRGKIPPSLPRHVM